MSDTTYDAIYAYVRRRRIRILMHAAGCRAGKHNWRRFPNARFYCGYCGKPRKPIKGDFA